MTRPRRSFAETARKERRYRDLLRLAQLAHESRAPEADAVRMLMERGASYEEALHVIREAPEDLQWHANNGGVYTLLTGLLLASVCGVVFGSLWLSGTIWPIAGWGALVGLGMVIAGLFALRNPWNAIRAFRQTIRHIWRR